MKKKLVFYFYITDDCLERKINQIHMQCLKHYASEFDEILFCLSIDDRTNTELIRKIEGYLISEIKCNGNISFKIYNNTNLREAIAFKNEIADHIGDDDLVFFAHNKGVTNESTYDRDNIYKWVSAMYYYSLNFMDEVERRLIAEVPLSYGPCLTVNEGTELSMAKYDWWYIGTFFWINSKKLKIYMDKWHIEIPDISNRFYAEDFLGSIYPRPWFASSHNDRYILNATDYYTHAVEYLEILYEDLSDFYIFYDGVALK